jgi:hypothetical protein
LGVQEARWEKVSTEQAENYTFVYGEGNMDQQLVTRFFIHKRIMSAVRRAEFISDRLAYIILSCWCNIIILNLHTPCEDNSDDVKDSFYEELGCVFDKCLGMI